MVSYTITPDEDGKGASIQFAKDRTLIDALKAEFPKARWSRDAARWHVPGVRALGRLERWATEHVPAEKPFEAQQLRDELTTFDPIKSTCAQYMGGEVVIVTTPYDSKIISALRAIPGASWNQAVKKWFVPLERRSVDALRAALPAIEARVAAVNAEQAAEKAASAAARAERRSRRELYPLDGLPVFDHPVRYGQGWIVYAERGKPFRISEDDPSVFGAHLLGHEGDLGCYCYYRPATPAEASEAGAEEAAAKAARDAENARLAELRATWQRIRDTGEQPDGRDNTAQGRDIYLSQRDREGAVYGYGSYLVVGPDWVWAIENHGADGDDWSANNVRTGGAGAIGWRIPADAALADRIMQLGQETGLLTPDYMAEQRAKIQAEEEKFQAEWTLGVTMARRAEWNNAVRSGRFGHPGGRVDVAGILAWQRQHGGWTADDLKRAVRLHNLPPETL